MILHEYAVEPECLVGWDRFNHIINYFGYKHGRLISRFPKHWSRAVKDACKNLEVMEKHKIIERLNADGFKAKKTIPANREYRDSETWIINAVRQHGIRNFHAIIAKQDISDLNFVAGVEEITEGHPLIDVPREEKIKRSPNLLAQCIMPLLENSSEILFIDAHFKSSRAKWPNALKEFLNVACRGKRINRCEFHIREDPSGEEPIDEEILKNKIPDGIKVRFLLWNYDGAPGEDFHARYILTELGGVRFDYGLDAPATDDRTDVSLLDTRIWRDAWNDFQKDTARYNLVSETEIIGRG